MHDMSDASMAQAMERDIRRRLYVASAFTIPVVLLSGHVPGVPMLPNHALANWIELALSAPVVW
ncbi:MAG TPA: hypothetical protein VG916_08045, partial [Gemmatimonadaceae bacterium]|nr:hypothetical protein [Gemmatimonadaceae bacterium]